MLAFVLDKIGINIPLLPALVSVYALLLSDLSGSFYVLAQQDVLDDAFETGLTNLEIALWLFPVFVLSGEDIFEYNEVDFSFW
jgi:hypothetical protein